MTPTDITFLPLQVIAWLRNIGRPFLTLIGPDKTSDFLNKNAIPGDSVRISKSYGKSHTPSVRLSSVWRKHSTCAPKHCQHLQRVPAQSLPQGRASRS